MKKALIIVALVLLIPVSWFSLKTAAGIYRSLFSPYLTRQLAGSIVITAPGIEIKPEKPLRAERQLQQLILDFEVPMEPNYAKWGITLSDGTVVVPRAELIDEYGNVYGLECTGLDRNGIGFSYRSELPRDREYRSVRLKADKPLRLSRVWWKCWNQWDVS